MIKKYLLGLTVFVLAFAILTISVLQSASVTNVFASPTPSSESGSLAKIPQVEYQLPFSGSVLPDSPFWVLKALRDRVWYLITFNPLKKAQLALLFSDKRIEASRTLFEEQKPDLALSTLTKGEKYLEMAQSEESKARGESMDTSTFLIKLATAALKHRQIIEENIIPNTPEDLRPEVIKSEDYAKNTYKSSRDALNSLNVAPPNDPFIGQ